MIESRLQQAWTDEYCLCIPQSPTSPHEMFVIVETRSDSMAENRGHQCHGSWCNDNYIKKKQSLSVCSFDPGVSTYQIVLDVN